MAGIVAALNAAVEATVAADVEDEFNILLALEAAVSRLLKLFVLLLPVADDDIFRLFDDDDDNCWF